MSKQVIKLIGLASGHKSKIDGEYLKYYDPDGHNGIGEVETTPDIKEALVFKDMAEAFELWKKTSKKIPIRPDGKPNRPLTAFSIVVEAKEKSR